MRAIIVGMRIRNLVEVLLIVAMRVIGMAKKEEYLKAICKNSE